MPRSSRSVVAVAVLALSVATGTQASAQPANAPPPMVAPTPSPSSSSTTPVPAPAVTPGGTTPATIPQPGPEATVEHVDKAKAVAKTAELTPILPSPNDATRPAFQLYAEVDLPILGLGIVMASARLVKTQKAFCAPQCDPADLNALDRTTAGTWNPTWSTASDIGLYAIIAGAATVLVVDEGVVDALNDSVVIAESALSATAVSSLMTLAAGRPRPFLFGTNAPLDTRNGADAGLSFLSSHTAVSFALATSSFMASRRLHPKSAIPLLVLGLGVAAASFVGTARVEGGNHFITDVVGGAIVGGSLGVLIPSLHTTPVKIVPVVSDTQKGFSMVGVF
jgi:membrane-associated phospholipid phosphatase